MFENRVINGDCLEALAELPEGCVDLAFADPPFNIGYKYDRYDDSRNSDDYLGWTGDWLAAVRRVLKPDGSFFVAIGDEYVAEIKIRLDALGLTMRNWIVWHYTFGVSCTKKFSRSHAHILYYVADPKRFTFNADAIRVPSARQTTYADRRANPRGVVAVYIPEYVVGRWWEQLLHNQTALRLKGRLLFQPGIMVISVPYQLQSSEAARERAYDDDTRVRPGDLRRGDVRDRR